MSYTFTVLDRGKPVNVAYSGGTAFNFVNNTPDPGIEEFPKLHRLAKTHGVKGCRDDARNVLLSNRSEFDSAVNENRMLAGRGDGPHSYEARSRLGPALFPGQAGLRTGGPAEAGTESGGISHALNGVA